MALTTAPGSEPIIEPELPIVDPHHHLWFHNAESLQVWEEWASPRTDDPVESVYAELAVQVLPFLGANNRYLFDELHANLTSGHNFRATVFEESLTMYRASGPEEMRSVGEVEFANGIGAMSASGLFGDVKLALGIIGNVDLSIGAAAKPVIEAHLVAGGERYRGVRCDLPADPGSSDLSSGLELLSEFGLSWNIFVLEPQLEHVIEIARRHPQLPIVLEHAGGPVGIAASRGNARSASGSGARRSASSRAARTSSSSSAVSGSPSPARPPGWRNRGSPPSSSRQSGSPTSRRR